MTGQDYTPHDPSNARIASSLRVMGHQNRATATPTKTPDKFCSIASKERTYSSYLSSSCSEKSLKQSSSPVLVEDAAAARVSSWNPSHASSTYNSTLETHQSPDPNSYTIFASTSTDLISISAWIDPHRTFRHHQDVPYDSDGSMNYNSCLYHASWELESHNNWAGYGSTPVERWLNESLGDEGVVAWQPGHQQPKDCTCIAIEVGIGEGAVNGTQLGVPSDD